MEKFYFSPPRGEASKSAYVLRGEASEAHISYTQARISYNFLVYFFSVSEIIVIFALWHSRINIYDDKN